MAWRAQRCKRHEKRVTIYKTNVKWSTLRTRHRWQICSLLCSRFRFCDDRQVSDIFRWSLSGLFHSQLTHLRYNRGNRIVNRYGVLADYVRADLSKQADVQSLWSRVLQLHPDGIDILINNAGTFSNWQFTLCSHLINVELFNVTLMSMFKIHTDQVKSTSPEIELDATRYL